MKTGASARVAAGSPCEPRTCSPLVGITSINVRKPSFFFARVQAIFSFGSEEQKRTYCPGVLTGDWIQAMPLTEPDAGSALADLRTAAAPQPDGSYRINGDGDVFAELARVEPI